MFRLLGYLKQCKNQCWRSSFCWSSRHIANLALPQYTSDIVDVGIQQGGIEYAAPEQMRKETFDA